MATWLVVKQWERLLPTALAFEQLRLSWGTCNHHSPLSTPHSPSLHTPVAHLSTHLLAPAAATHSRAPAGARTTAGCTAAGGTTPAAGGSPRPGTSSALDATGGGCAGSGAGGASIGGALGLPLLLSLYSVAAHLWRVVGPQSSRLAAVDIRRQAALLAAPPNMKRCFASTAACPLPTPHLPGNLAGWHASAAAAAGGAGTAATRLQGHKRRQKRRLTLAR